VPDRQADRRSTRARAALDATVLAMIEKRRENLSQGDDLLRQLIEAQDETGSAMTDRQLLDEVRTIFLAGLKRRRWRWLIH